MKRTRVKKLRVRDLRVGVIVARFNRPITRGLEAGSRRALREAKVPARQVTTMTVPGSFELPLAAQTAAQSGKFDCVVALGAVIRGDTDHNVYIAREASHGLAEVSRRFRMPIGFGVVTCDTMDQARERSGPNADNRGYLAAHAAVEMVKVIRKLLR